MNPNTMNRIGFVVVLGILWLAGIGVWVLRQARNLCGNELASEQPSPDGKLKVVVFERDCGATTRFSTQASILANSEELPNESGNIFTAADDDLPIGVQ